MAVVNVASVLMWALGMELARRQRLAGSHANGDTAMQGVRADLLAVKRILEVIAPIPAAASPSRSVVEPDSTTVEAVLDATRPMPEIAGSCGKAIDRLAANDELMIRARALSGEELSERAEFAAISLANGYVPTPGLVVADLGRACRLAGEGLEGIPAVSAAELASRSAVATQR